MNCEYLDEEVVVGRDFGMVVFPDLNSLPSTSGQSIYQSQATRFRALVLISVNQ